MPRPSKEKGFMAYLRELPPDLPVEERVRHYDEFTATWSPEQTRDQSYRCMNCGVPFCQYGCPLGNIIPDFNDLVKDDQWRDALDRLHSTNNFPEFTGRVCPAPCEAACVLGITEPPVTIKLIEREIGDRGWQEGWIRPQPPKKRSGKRVAIVGSGPAGLAAAQQLNRAGHYVTVFERADEPGGLLTYGIPDFKLSKVVVCRRLDQMRAEGVEFRCNVWVGKEIPATRLVEDFDIILLTIGATKSRDLDIPGRDLAGIHLAMEFLCQQNRRVARRPVLGREITARGKNVIILGGGDTGSDCLGTSHRQGAKKVWSFELLPKPPLDRIESNPWPQWPFVLYTSSSHKEGGERDWSVMTKRFSGEDGQVRRLHAVRWEWGPQDENGRRPMVEIPRTDFEIECELVLLALGFVHPEHDIATQLGLELDARGNIRAGADFRTSHDKVFAAGDARRGQSLVVWAIHEGREAAREIDLALRGYSDLPSAASHGYDAVPLETAAG
ncbi:MAG: glutamate synthase subunit beta [Candidatus Hydrogenedentes bacterium]|nr:glutamate synthase subunit beta [Candidatus Hydrogenedentota bacterium]